VPLNQKDLNNQTKLYFLSKMKGYFNNTKKGVSPLIATVLLIAFAVALGAVVMNWGRAQLDPSNNKNLCSEVEINLEKINQMPNICYSNSENYVSFLLRNDGSLSVLKFRITLISEDQNTYNNVINQRIDSGETKRLQSNFPSDLGKIQKVRISPILISDMDNPLSNEQTCVDKSIEFLNPLFC
jgi:flagellin-like protein